MSAALLAVALALVGNLATNLVEVDRPWWRPVVFSTLVLLVVGVLVLEWLPHRAARAREELDPAVERARVLGAIPRAAWRWQPRPVEQKRVWETMGRRGQGGIGGGSGQVSLGCLMGRHDKAVAGRDIDLRGCS